MRESSETWKWNGGEPRVIASDADAVITNFDRQLKMANAVCTALISG